MAVLGYLDPGSGTDPLPVIVAGGLFLAAAVIVIYTRRSTRPPSTSASVSPDDARRPRISYFGIFVAVFAAIWLAYSLVRAGF